MLQGSLADTPIDWRPEGILTNVKNQGSCGSCWAFAATTTMEAIWHKNYGTEGAASERMSEQQLVDCDPTSSGCNGGWMDWAWYYMMQSGKGGMLYNDYPTPYNAVDQVC